MKTLFLTLTFILSLSTLVHGQKIKENSVDEFTGQHKVSTSWEKIKSGNGFTGKDHLFFSFYSMEKNIYFNLKWVTDKKMSINADSKIIFKLNNGKLITLYSLSDEKSAIGHGAIGLSMSAIEGISVMYKGNTTLFDDEKTFVNKVRIETASGNVDFDLKEKSTKKINAAYKILKEEVGGSFAIDEINNSDI